MVPSKRHSGLGSLKHLDIKMTGSELITKVSNKLYVIVVVFLFCFLKGKNEGQDQEFFVDLCVFSVTVLQLFLFRNVSNICLQVCEMEWYHLKSWGQCCTV